LSFSVIKKPLALLLVMAMIGVVGLMAANTVESQQLQQGQGPDQYGGGYSVPGAPGISLGPGTNTVALSVSIASQQDNQIYFQVNSFAVMDQQTQAFTVYDLSNAMPGIMDTSNNRVQIDIGKLQTSIKSTSQASMDDLYNVLRPSVSTLMVVADISQQGQEGARATFQVQSLKVIMPDGQTNAFDLSKPMAIVVDGSAMRVFTVGFDQLYSLVNTYIVNIQNNYYTEINYNVVTGPTIIVTPPAAYPVLTPITFPAVWPIYYPVPVPVPIPVVTVKPHPPSVTPTKMPTGSPTKMPTGSPTGKPTISPTGKPTVSGTTKPTVTATKMPTGSPKISATGMPTKKPTASPKISLIASKTPILSPKASFLASKKPVITLKATKSPVGVVTKKPVSTVKAPIATYKATKSPIGAVTKLPVSTIKPPIATYKAPKTPVSGGGGIATKKPVNTYKAPFKAPKTPVSGVEGVIPTKKPVTGVKVRPTTV
jgi:hypothetical protein